MHPEQNFSPEKPSSLNNIEVFDSVTAKLFDYLYDAFPVTRNIDPVAFVRTSHETPHTDEAIWRDVIAIHAVSFLHDEGYITHARVGDGSNRKRYDVRLTSKALAKLKAPALLQNTEATTAEAIRSLVKNAGDGLVGGGISLLLAKVFNG